MASVFPPIRQLTDHYSNQMKNILRYCLPLPFVYLLATYSLAQPLTLSLTDHVVDLTKRNWRFVAYEPKQTPSYAEVSARKDWQPIQVGQRWEFLGHPELIDKTV